MIAKVVQNSDWQGATPVNSRSHWQCCKPTKCTTAMAICWWSAPHLLLIIAATAAPSVVAVYLLYRLFKKKKDAAMFGSPPGPPGLPILGNLLMLGSQPHRSLHNLAKKYGPIMSIRLGLVPTVVVSSSRTADLFLRTHNPTFADQPSGDYGEFLLYGQKGVVLADYGPYWRGVRKLCIVHLLSSRKVDVFRPVRREELRRFIRSINDAATGGSVPVDLSAHTSALVTDVMCRALLGKTSAGAWGLDKIIRRVMDLGGAFNVNDYFPFIGVLDVQGIRRRMKAVRKAYDEFIQLVINEHVLSLKAGRKLEKDMDLVDTMLSSMGSDDGGILNDWSNIKAILMDLIVGGVDTSAATIVWTMTELLRHPRVMKKVQQELEDAVGLNRMVEEEGLRNLRYLDMAVKEAMRLHPAIPLIGRKAREDCTVGGFHIREGTQVLVNVWAIGRDPSDWKDAEAFYPERFAGSVGGAAGDFNDLQALEFPVFGGGSRRCPGMYMGLTMVRTVVAQLVHCFEWEIPGGGPHGELDTTESFGVVAPKADPLLAVPVYRLRGEVA